MTRPDAFCHAERLRAEGWKVTTARLSVLQALETLAPCCVSAEDVHRHLVRQGSSTSIGSVYRILHEFHARDWLEREWGPLRTALYRVRSGNTPETNRITLVCAHSGQRLELSDQALCEQLIAVARRGGLMARGAPLSVRLGGS